MSARKCVICSRPLPSSRASSQSQKQPAAENEPTEMYCVYHTQAYNGLHSHYRTWVEAYGEIAWKDYLTRVKEQNETGSWIREIAEAELKKIQK